MILDDLLKLTVQDGASDLHLTAGSVPCYRLNGSMVRLEYPTLTDQSISQMIESKMSQDQLAHFRKHNDIDLGLYLPGVARFRANFFVNHRGEAAVFRVIPERIRSASELNLPKIVSDLAREENGLILVTGPTGSGKSTTLAAIVDIVNSERSSHILTVEDPIEFVHQHKKCLVNQREVHSHTQSFASALRAALREDPDVILVGEMRDLETMELAITAAETGHLVLATLHTTSAPQTIDRVIGVFPPHQQPQIRMQLSESLRAVVSQTLIPGLEGGRVAALEIMTGISAVRNLIREGKTFQLRSVIETNARIGMQTLEQCLRTMVEQKLISKDEAAQRGLVTSGPGSF